MTSCGVPILGQAGFGSCGQAGPAARGVLPDQGLNLCLLCWQADSPPLGRQGGPLVAVANMNEVILFIQKSRSHYKTSWNQTEIMN